MSKSKASGPSSYEVLFIVANNYTEEEAKTIVSKVEAIISENGGNITYREFWGKKKLAYVIKQNHYGYYSLCEFNAKRETIAKLDRTLRLSHEVLRHQIISIKAVSDEERAKIKEKQEQSAVKNEKKEEKTGKEKFQKVMTSKNEKTEKNDSNKADLKDLDEKLEGILNNTQDLL
ncbi:MAG TPA: 30S ribosomal protein S6 [bacterium]|jgi:small subunit ribosomal protein S6|nr:MAG: 30S ribosomal protein S6 [Parcubacteria group bacterium ADurb.Bin115]HNU81742.1 30S ribosomal protein S6 [bacterium]HOD87307.1 30S ribosomal protein S6 [bacterium]HPY99450.1 30S ribosomal protein S6 [bacterium]HQB76455.1 30S ribosomal protein S6 [bacterium]